MYSTVPRLVQILKVLILSLRAENVYTSNWDSAEEWGESQRLEKRSVCTGAEQIWFTQEIAFQGNVEHMLFQLFEKLTSDPWLLSWKPSAEQYFPFLDRQNLTVYIFTHLIAFSCIASLSLCWLKAPGAFRGQRLTVHCPSSLLPH